MRKTAPLGKPPAERQDFYTTEEAAGYLRLSVGALLKQVSKGNLRVALRGGPGKPRRAHLFAHEDLVQYVQSLSEDEPQQSHG